MKKLKILLSLFISLFISFAITLSISLLFSITFLTSTASAYDFQSLNNTFNNQSFKASVKGKGYNYVFYHSNGVQRILNIKGNQIKTDNYIKFKKFNSFKDAEIEYTLIKRGHCYFKSYYQGNHYSPLFQSMTIASDNHFPIFDYNSLANQVFDYPNNSVYSFIKPIRNGQAEISFNYLKQHNLVSRINVRTYYNNKKYRSLTTRFAYKPYNLVLPENQLC